MPADEKLQNVNPPAQPGPAAPVQPAPVPSSTPAAKPVVTEDAKKAKKAARKELRAMHSADKKAPGFDHKRYHALHYLSLGQDVPSTDPDDLD